MTNGTVDLSSVKVFKNASYNDARGDFTKYLTSSFFDGEERDLNFVEYFVSTSRKNVLRGMHYQKAPHGHAKLVSIISGRILDVILCIDQSSPDYGKTKSFVMTKDGVNSIYIPEGFAHGFLSLEEWSVVSYLTTSVHSPEHDSGVLWNSFGFEWPVEAPNLSDRDQKFPRFL